MRTLERKIEDLKNGGVMVIGFVGENQHTRVVLDAGTVYREYPHASVGLTVGMDGIEPYPAVVTRVENTVVWDVLDSSLTREGYGEIQLTFTDGTVVVRTYIGQIRVLRSMVPTGEIPEPLDDFLAAAGEALTAIPETIDAALEAAKESGEFDGEDGFSPVVNVTDITGGHRVVVTDASGDQAFDVMDGHDGEPGDPGRPGADGVSPVANVVKVGDTATITITDKSGTTTAEVHDGQALDVIDDTAGDGDTDRTWSADKLVDQFDLKAPKDNPVFTGSISLGRAANSTVGAGSVAEGSSTTASGPNSHAEGGGTIASSNQSHAEGGATTASGQNSHAEGGDTIASKYCSHAEGGGTTASGNQSHAEGAGTIASGSSSHAEGSETTASGASSHAEGGGTTASGQNSHAEGGVTTASGQNSHAEGGGTKASGSHSHAEGGGTKASGDQSHAEGIGGTFTINGTTYTSEAKGTADHTEGYMCLTASGQPGNHAEGYQTRATGGAAHAEGNITFASGVSAHAEGSQTTASGNQSHAEGSGTTASGGLSHAEGGGTTASGNQSHAEGAGTIASGSSSHAEGFGTIASDPCSHAEGGGTTASGNSSHAEGGGTTASGSYSHAEGGGTIASGQNSHAEGGSTIASGRNSHVFGSYNIEDSYANWPEWVSGKLYHVGDKMKITTGETGSEVYTGYICKTENSDVSFTSSKWYSGVAMNYVEIVGNGTAQARSNARTLDWDGNERLKGDLYVGCNADSSGGTKVAKVTDIPDPASIIDDTAGSGDTGKVWSADKSSDLMQAISQKQDAPETAGTDGQFLGMALVDGQLVPVWTELPTATSSVAGIAKFNSSYGIYMNSQDARIVSAYGSEVKAGTHAFRPITPSNQDSSVYYALAKLAGADMKNVTGETVGVYPEAQKVAICNMIEPQFRLIKEITITESTQKVYVNTDSNGDSFTLNELVLLFEGMKASNNGAGAISVNNGNSQYSSSAPFLCLANLFYTTAITKSAHLWRKGGKLFGDCMGSSVSNTYTPVNATTSLNATGIIDCNSFTELCIGSMNDHSFTEGTIKIYGR